MEVPKAVCGIIYALCIFFGLTIAYFRLPKIFFSTQLLIVFGAPLLLSVFAFWITHFFYKEFVFFDKIKLIRLRREINAPADFIFAIFVFFATFSSFNVVHTFMNSNTSSDSSPSSTSALVEDHSRFEVILQSREKLKDVQLDWEKLSEGETSCRLVSRGEPSKLGKEFYDLGQQVERSGAKQEKHSKIEAYRNAQYAYLIASDVECDAEMAKIYAHKSIKFGNLALTLIEGVDKEVKNLLEEDESYEKRLMVDWLIPDFTEERILFYTALGNSLLYRWGNQSENRANAVRESLEKITRNKFYEENGVNLDSNRFVAPFIENTLPKESDFSHPCANTCGILNH